MSGQGALRVAIRGVDQESAVTNLTAHFSGNWGYIDVPEKRDDSKWHIRAEGMHGKVRVGFMSVVARDWPPIWNAGQTETMSAATFFHAGYSDPVKGIVTLEPDRVAQDVVFYGPRMPLSPGRYRVELFWDAAVSPETSVGLWKIIPGGAEVDVVAGRPTVLEFDWTDEGLFAAGFYFYRQAAVILREVRLMRVR
jgi:hypothetical protein